MNCSSAAQPYSSSLFVSVYCDLRIPHSFPTRRSSDLGGARDVRARRPGDADARRAHMVREARARLLDDDRGLLEPCVPGDRKSTRLNSSHVETSYAVVCLKKKRGGRRIVLVRLMREPR